MYTHNYDIDYLFIEEDLTTSFVRLMYYVQETSLHHSNSTAYTMEWYLKNNTGFVLTGWNIKLHNLPRWGEKISVSTWPSKFKGMLADRSFVVYDSNNEVVLEAQSNWIYMDFNTLKPSRVNEEMFEAYAPLGDPVLNTKVKIPKTDDYKYLFTKSITTTISNIDSNHHVNNISYITFVVDALGISSKDIDSMSIRYVKETSINENLNLEFYQNEKEYNVTIVDDENVVKAQVLLTIK